MKKTLILVLVIACVASLTLLAGCGKGSETADIAGENEGAMDAGESGGNDGGAESEQPEDTTEEGKKITVEESEEEGESDKVIIEGESGQESTIEVQEQEPSEESLGAPLYPGAKLVEGSSVSGKTTSPDGKEISVTGGEFISEDDITKVVNWYKGKIGAPSASAPETATWMKQEEDGSVVTVIVEIYEGQVKITIVKVVGDIGIDL